MGYWTFFHGELEIKLNDLYLTILHAYLDRIFDSQDVIRVTNKTLTVEDSWKNRLGTMEDIVLYIEKYGELISGKIHCLGEDGDDVWEIVIKDGESYIQRYGFNKSTRKKSTLNSLKKDLLQEGGVQNYNMDIKKDTDGKNDLIDEIEDWLDQLTDFDFNEDETDIYFKKINEGFKKNIINLIDFRIGDCLYTCEKDSVFRNNMTVVHESKNDLKQVQTIFNLGFISKDFTSKDNFLSLTNIDIHEPRKIETKYGIIPLNELFMKRYYKTNPKTKIYELSHGEKEVILPNGKRTSFCDVCVNRLQKLTSGCQQCTPKRIPITQKNNTD